MVMARATRWGIQSMGYVVRHAWELLMRCVLQQSTFIRCSGRQSHMQNDVLCGRDKQSTPLLGMPAQQTQKSPVTHHAPPVSSREGSSSYSMYTFLEGLFTFLTLFTRRRPSRVFK